MRPEASALRTLLPPAYTNDKANQRRCPNGKTSADKKSEATEELDYACVIHVRMLQTNPKTQFVRAEAIRRIKNMEVHEMRVVFLNILALLLLFASLQLPPPQENYYPLQHRLFENFHG